MIARGKVWKFGDKIPTDLITPVTLYTLEFEEMAKHVLERVNPDFPKLVKPGDILVAGINFGCSSGRTFAPKGLKATKIGAVVVESISRTFYRNAHECGLPIIICPDITQHVNEGDDLEVNIETGEIINHTNGKRLQGEAPQGLLKLMIMNGGLLKFLETEEGQKYLSN